MMRRSLAFAASLALAATAACSPTEEPTQQPSRNPTAGIPPVVTKATSTATPAADPFPSPSPSPTPIEGVVFPPAPKNEPDEQRAIREGWEAYETQLDRYMRDSKLKDLTELAVTTTGSETQFVIESIGSARDDGIIRVGEVPFRDLHIDPPHKNADGVEITNLQVCKVFTKQREVLESTGKTFVEEGVELAKTMHINYVMQRQSDGRWVVASGEGKGNQC